MTATSWVLLATSFFLLWPGAALLLSAWSERRRRPTLSERLRPYTPDVGQAAPEWLRR